MSEFYPDNNANTPDRLPETEQTTPVTPAEGTVAPVSPAEQSTDTAWTKADDNGCTYHYAPPRQVPPTYTQQTPSPVYQPPTTPSKPPKKKMSGEAKLLCAVSVLCVVLLVVCGALTVGLLSAEQTRGDDGQSSASSSDTSTDDTSKNDKPPTLSITESDEMDGGLTNTQIVERNLNSTVMIDIYEYVSYGHFNNQGNRNIEKTGSATGIVWTKDGYIITNSHCVADEDSGETYPRIDVELYDGTVYEKAEIIGFDTTSDLAVIKINATNLQPAVFGDSSALRLGDRVVAIGNPGGLGFTSTVGTISGLERDVYEDAGYAIKCLQTDTVINPGNSGGPLINAFGQVVAINSAKIVAEGYEGLGFSIPITEAQPILNDLVEHNYVTGRVSLGIKGYSVTTVGYEGFQIAEILEGSALENTRAREGDIICKIDDVRVTDYSSLRAELAKHKVGDTVTLGLMRYDGDAHQIVTLEVSCVLNENRG